MTSETMSPFIFKTKWGIKEFIERITAAGAEMKEIRDEGFACFIYFQDPFNRNWIVMSEKD